jgi:hypothetical protein
MEVGCPTDLSVLIVASALALWGATGVEAQTVVTPLFPGITHIKRTEQYPPFQCPGCPAPTPNPRLARMNILLIDLTSPGVHFKLTPPGENLPAVAPGSTTQNWPAVPFEVVRQRTLDFLNTSHAHAAINVHFFAPFPVPGGSTQGAYAYVIGLAGHGAGPGRQRGDGDGHLHRPARQRQGEVARVWALATLLAGRWRLQGLQLLRL